MATHSLPAQKQDKAIPVTGDSADRLSRCLSLDLEVNPKDERIRAFAGVRPDRDEVLIFPAQRSGLSAALDKLDDLADGADFVLGHNLIRFDLPHLRAVNPRLRLLRLPMVDTLWLNPLAFPRNPYHYLVKHYQDGQLKRGRINDPELDARLALEVFANQQKAFRAASPELLTAWHWLATTQEGAGFDRLFAALRKAPRPSDREAYRALHQCLEDAACRTYAQTAVEDAADHSWELAYVLAWLSVAGSNSVMPPWVRHQFPDTGRLVRRLRDTACGDPACGWCRERHNVRKELKRWFRFDDFRAEPVDAEGQPLQRSIVDAAMAGEHLLAILPTGAGKSLCYQLPALSRYDKIGALTVVISPLVALMADQVDGLEKRGIGSCVTVNGLLSMPERADVLERIRLGDAGILLISPEQLRSTALRRALDQREIGGWVLDEAHCLSKWGHDFRPDYRYVGRFIRERAGEGPVPPVLCLTATAKPDVRDEIVAYFRDQLAIPLRIFDGGAQRTNLEFVVVPTSGEAKIADIHRILTHDMPAGEPGGAIVYCATRRRAEEVAEFLQAQGMAANFFHAGLTPEVKKQVQTDFIQGELRAIAATNAFGMGIDKPDVRLVVHADIPGSLENYLQEAGRAGRDQQTARCILLYTQDDVERQFGMSALSRLTRREIHGVLRALRNLDRKKRLQGEVIATAGEILREDDENAFERDAATDDTRVRTAVAWLEEAVLLRREENRVQVFPSSLRVDSMPQVRDRLGQHKMKESYRKQLHTICETLIEADVDEGVSTDELMAASGLTPEGVRRALYDLEELGLVSNDTALTAFVHAGVQHSSQRRLQAAEVMEQSLIDLLRENAADMEKGETYDLHLRQASQELKNEGHAQALPERLRRLVRSIAADGRGEGGQGGSLGMRGRDSETLQVTLKRSWGALRETARLRRAGAAKLLEHLLSELPTGSRGTDLLAATTLGKLLEAVKSDPYLRSRVKDPAKLMDRALLWLHEQEIIRLNKGLTVLRPAMTIQLEPERRGFAQADYVSLQFHYDEQVRQIHVMAAYAQRGLESMADALHMAMDYFSLEQEDFLQRWLPDREISRQTTRESWQRIVEDLNNPVQRRIVVDDRETTNVLVLAGPGSGKTRVLVHRIAYLVRVRRENPQGILALAYNRHAAVEIRQRLAALIGEDARRVVVLTCHAFAMRLVGASFEGRANHLDDGRFQEVIHQATAFLKGEGVPPEEADEQRARLLRGFRWILVDEYQDIGADEYDLISALAGRTLDEADDRLSLFAVGDDDQNIYTFKGSSTKFIRRFEEDYKARPVYLTENYRSTAHIIRAANAWIEPAQERMKTGEPIQINRARAKEPPGGRWTIQDPLARGRVQIVPAGDSPLTQAQAVVAELQRLRACDPNNWDWSLCAVLAREWKYLDPVRSLCERERIPVQLGKEELPGVWHLRETQALLRWIRAQAAPALKSEEMKAWLAQQPPGPWNALLCAGVAEYEAEAGACETPRVNFIEWLAEWSREVRRRPRGLQLLTAHGAKGLEFDHVVVLDGGWERRGGDEDADASRRLYYVSMTRARQTLALMRLPGSPPLPTANGAWCARDPVRLPPPPPELARRYQRLSLRDVFLSFAGYRHPKDGIHQAIAALAPGDRLTARSGAKRWELRDSRNRVVGKLASGFEPVVKADRAAAKVLAIATWDQERSEDQYRNDLRCPTWEVVVPELIFEPPA